MKKYLLILLAAVSFVSCKKPDDQADAGAEVSQDADAGSSDATALAGDATELSEDVTASADATPSAP